MRKKLFPTQAVLAKGHPAHQTIATLAAQFGDMYDSIKSIQEYARTRALHDFARAYLDRYKAAKTQMAALDYDDLILSLDSLIAKFLSDDIRAFLTGLIEPMMQGKLTDQKK